MDKGAKKLEAAKKHEATKKRNTAVYITGLPTDVSVQELADYFKKGY
jgi:hypothetical protein